MTRLEFGMRVFGRWSFVIGLLAAGCSGSEPGKGSGITTNGGSGGGGSGGGGTCLNIGCAADAFTLSTRLMDQCITHCGDSSSDSSSTHQAAFEDGEFFMESSSTDLDAGPPADGGQAPIRYALVRLPDEGPLGGHWLCAAGGTLDQPTPDGAAQGYELTQLSDLGPCEGDPASTDSLSIAETTGSAASITGTVDGVQVVNATSSSACSGNRCVFSVARQAGETAGYIAVRTAETPIAAEAVPVSEAAWVAPRHLSYHLICAGEGSTITRTSEGGSQATLSGLRKKTCPGMPLAGTIEGKLTNERENAASR